MFKFLWACYSRIRVSFAVSLLRRHRLSDRIAGVALLGEFGGSGAVEPLIQALGDEDRDVRRAAAQSLSKLGDPRSMSPLIHVLGDEDPNVRLAAAHALDSLGEKQWKKWINGRSSDFQQLAESGDPQAQEVLYSVIERLTVALSEARHHDRKTAAVALCDILTARGSPAIDLTRWGKIRELITTPHTDVVGLANCVATHHDTGIGGDLPAVPTAAIDRQRDF